MGLKLPRADLNRAGEWVEFGRSLAALLFIPCLCLYAVLMVLLMWKGGWADDTQAQRLDYFGYALIGLLILIGLGLFWLQRRELPNVNIQGPGFRAQIGEAGEGMDLEIGTRGRGRAERHRPEGEF